MQRTAGGALDYFVEFPADNLDGFPEADHFDGLPAISAQTDITVPLAAQKLDFLGRS